MSFLSIPSNPDEPIKLCGMPLVRFIVSSVVIALGHRLLVLGLFLLGFGWGMACFTNSGYSGASNICMLFVALLDLPFQFSKSLAEGKGFLVFGLHLLWSLILGIIFTTIRLKRVPKPKSQLPS
ncbi:MAG: hypothetical protein ACFUZC_22455 [Chthoniobacteraceae bacterium]